LSSKEIILSLLLLCSTSLFSSAYGQILIADEDSKLNLPRENYIETDEESETHRIGHSMNWAAYSSIMLELENQQRTEGYAYAISGGLVLLGSSIGYAKADGALEKSVYSVAQSLSIASIGYGIYRLQVGNQERALFKVIAASDELTEKQKLSMMKYYYKSKEQLKETNKWIRFFTYMAMGSLNIYHASQEANEDLKVPLYALGGASVLISLSIVF
jgi:hypothetical protein